MNIIQQILKLPLLVKIIIIVAIYFIFFRKENFGVDYKKVMRQQRQKKQKQNKGMMGQFMSLFEEPKKKRKTDAISESKLFIKLFKALSDKGYDEDEAWEKAYTITKKQIIKKQNEKKKKMMKNPTSERGKLRNLISKYKEMGHTDNVAKTKANKELVEMAKRKIAEERNEDISKAKEIAVQRNKQVETDPRIGKFMNQFMRDNEGAPESEGLEYAKNIVRKLKQTESEVKKNNLKIEKEALLKAQEEQQKVLKEAQQKAKIAEIEKREADKKAKAEAIKAQRAKEAAIKKQLEKAKRDKEKMEAAKQRELLKAQKAQQKVLKEAEEAKKKASLAQKEAEKKIAEAKTENIKAKIEENTAELAKIEETEIKADQAVNRAKRAKRRADRKAKEAKKAVDKAKEATKEAILKERRTILPPGTKKGQVLKWDGTKWALGEDNIS